MGGGGGGRGTARCTCSGRRSNGPTPACLDGLHTGPQPETLQNSSAQDADSEFATLSWPRADCLPMQVAVWEDAADEFGFGEEREGEREGGREGERECGIFLGWSNLCKF